jgi:serine/threonine protein kinase
VTLSAGDRLGPYEIQAILGRGGMGEVYQATDASSGQPVALKLIRPDCLDPNNLRLFEMEAAALARVRSPYVAQVLDAGGTAEELPFLVMEYIEGRSLAAILRERGRLSLWELGDLVHDLSLAHEAAVLHSDVKPHNIMLTTCAHGPRWKLVDFGVARLQMQDVVTDSVVAGTPQYMSPEQARGERIDTRSDVYSLSLVIYRALTGRPSFTRDDEHGEGPPDPGYYLPVSEDVGLVLRIGLAARPADRFTTMRRLGEAFAAAAEGRLDDETRAQGRELLAREPWSIPGEPARDELDPYQDHE